MTVQLRTQACPGCGSALGHEARFCSACGTPVRPDECASCGRPLPVDGSFCPGCGAAVAAIERPARVLGYASFGRRLLATLIDLALVAAMFVVIDGVWFAAYGSSSSNRAGLALGVMSTFLAAAAGYAIGLEASRWQATVGKLALGLRVTREDGGRIGAGRAAGRVLGRCLTVLTVGLGYLTIPLTDHRTALHDIVTGTVVRRVGR